MRALLLTFGLVAALSSPAAAAICSVNPTSASAPVRVPRSAADLGDFGVIPSACAGTDLALDLGARLTIAVEEFYGGLSAGVAVRGRLALTDRLWLSASAPGVAFDMLVNATVTGLSLRPTAMTLGVHYAMFPGEVAQVSPYVRVLVPTDGRRHGAVRGGMEVGAAFAVALHEWVQLVGGVGFPVTDTAMGRRHLIVSTPTLALDVAFRPATWFAAVAGLGLRFRSGGEERLEAIDPRVSVRFFPGSTFLIDLSMAFPVAGRDLTDSSVLLALGWSPD